VSKCEATEFCATTIFFIVFLGSGFMLLMLWLFYEKGRTRLKSRQGNKIQVFFLQDLSVKKMIYIPIGLIGVLGVSFIISSSQIPYASYISIFASGMIMFFCFDRTHSISIPILIHGAYNSIVVALRSSASLSSFPIDVPTIGVDIAFFGRFISEIIFQLTLVASSEELFKIFVVAFIIISAEGGFRDNNKMKIIAYVSSCIVWTVYHSIAGG